MNLRNTLVREGAFMIMKTAEVDRSHFLLV